MFASLGEDDMIEIKNDLELLIFHKWSLQNEQQQTSNLDKNNESEKKGLNLAEVDRCCRGGCGGWRRPFCRPFCGFRPWFGGCDGFGGCGAGFGGWGGGIGGWGGGFGGCGGQLGWGD
jgi:hypothetical protein